MRCRSEEVNGKRGFGLLKKQVAVKGGGVGDEKVLFQAEATATRLSMPRYHYYYTFATSDEVQNTHARKNVSYRLMSERLLSQSQRCCIIIAKNALHAQFALGLGERI